MIGAADGCRCSCSVQGSSSSCIHSGPQSVCGATGYPACRLGGSLCTSSHSTCGGRATDQAVFLGREAAASVKLLTEVASALPHYPRHGHALAEQQLLLLERQQRFRCAEHESEEAGSGSGDGKWCVGAGASPGWRGGGGMCSNTALSGVARGMDKWGCSERAGSLGRASGESPGPAAIQQTGGIERTAGNDAGVNQSERGRLVGGMCGSLGSLATNLGVYREVLKPGDSHYSFCLVAVSRHERHSDQQASGGNVRGTAAAEAVNWAAHRGHTCLWASSDPNFISGVACPFRTKVCKIERLHNPLLLQRYLHERESMMLFKGNRDCASVDDVIGNPILRVQPEHAGTVNLNEFFLFHGCKANRAKLIAVSGFDCRRAGENRGKLFGVGTYFSPLASKADLYSRSPQDSSAPPITSPKPPHCGGSAGAAGYSSFASPSRAGGVTSWGSGGGAAAFQRKRNALSGASGHVASGSTSMGIGRRAPKTPKNDKRRSSVRGPGVLGFASCALQKAGSTGKAKESDPRQLECFYPTMCSRPVAGRGECMACMRSFASVASGNSAGFDSCGGVLGDLSESSGDDSRNESRGRAHADERDLRSGGGHLQTASDTSVDGGKHGRDRTQEQPKTVVRTLVLSRVCLGEVYKATRAMPEARMPPAMADPGLDSCSGAGGKGPAYMLGGGGCGAAAASCTPGDVAGSTGIPGVPLRQEPQLVPYDSGRLN
ncbi:hypothetical protein BESB_013960 [Besnoitia besnoiti]|uniref:PARP catalytic domain-containing protein n=1 Tax=Besnoitia besnoiti TaxID=94643 RepID=A0A2A9M6H1_BESBE|nr:hypothetical protein BESB_013960 [Besnoitia besnoiti]PFH32784.1 hypothetical protein BESB_013960 [Besnoitia besnoiti]